METAFGENEILQLLPSLLASIVDRLLSFRDMADCFGLPDQRGLQGVRSISRTLVLLLAHVALLLLEELSLLSSIHDGLEAVHGCVAKTPSIGRSPESSPAVSPPARAPPA
jgi:hypothetical protein